MKIIYTLILFLLISVCASAQQGFNLTFEDTTVINQVFYTDSLLDPQGIWQIGSPHKSFMDSSLSQPNGIVTGLDSLLPPNSKGSFIIAVPSTQYGPTGGLLTFVHRFEFDRGHGGGYVEYSMDTGRTWSNINLIDSGNCDYGYQFLGRGNNLIAPPGWRGLIPMDTTVGGIPIFSGRDSIWVYDTISFPTFIFAVKTSLLTTPLFRFTVFTDSNSQALGGWQIDNIKFSSYTIVCGGGINELNSAHLRVYPDPATDVFQLSMMNEAVSDYEVMLTDLAGRVLMRRVFSGQEIQIRRGDIVAGSYFIQVTDRRTQNTFQKRIVFN